MHIKVMKQTWFLHKDPGKPIILVQSSSNSRVIEIVMGL
jgi:hypothetical protein